MNRRSLPRQIVLLAATLVTLFAVVFWVSILSIRSAMDRQAEDESLILMEGRLRAVQDQVSLIASDYHNWTDVFEAAEALDFEELYSNYGITAVRADVFQYAQMFDGPFDHQIAWFAGSPPTPQSGFLSRKTRDALRREVPELDYQNRKTFDFFELRSGRAVVFSASWLLPEDAFIVPDRMEGRLAIAAIGKIVTDQQLQQIEEQLGVSDLRVEERRDLAGALSLPLKDASGDEIAFLYWTPPSPGTVFLSRIRSIMVGATLAFAFLAFWAARQLLDRAAELARKEKEAVLLARTDPLTQLPNRLALREHLSSFSGTDLKRFAALCLDINRFKQINDIAGHAGGDSYLKEIAGRIGTLSDETTFVARHGGSQFFLIISGGDELEARIDFISVNIERLCAAKVVVGGAAFDVSVSKGLAFSEPREQAYEEVLLRADRAMNHAKVRRTQDVVRYDTEMQAADAFETSVEKALRAALVSGSEFSLHYQPIVSGHGAGQVVKFEALARWNSAALGRVSPADFIRIAESSGLIVPLGKLLLERACADLAANPGTRINFNVSPVQLMTPGFTKILIGEVERHRLDSRRIEIEVTENVVIMDHGSVGAVLHELHSRGFSIALDDFGTGFSSLGYLASMPFNVLKIDRSFVSGEAAGEKTMSMVKSMISLAHSLDMAVVAEGIETEQEALTFWRSGCDMLQGYYFGRPKPLAEMPSVAQLEFDFEPTAPVTTRAPRPRSLVASSVWT